ncbi:anthranilate synthase family protein [Streptomyces sp. I05A-00742]|uniref:anthranilate synthase family protein n=1 Tax=Streptomyces sp. I05A-00742 TaxID=2732853 RepID=UPI001489FFDE|nr:anthranilate synthase family protein [Streptomyces sp. I05A-00742]
MTDHSANSGTGPDTASPVAADRLIDRILAADPPAFAVLHRPEATGRDRLDVMTGEVTHHETLADLPVRPPVPGRAGHDVLAIVPYRQIAERGYACVDDGAPLIAMAVGEHATVPVADLTARIADAPVRLTGGHFDTDDAAYAEIVRSVIEDEIGTGEGANFVIRRSFVAEISDYTPHTALVVFRRLLERESGAYWTFVVHTGDRTFVGATPERHITLDRGTAVMNPISGTYRYPESGPTLAGMKEFIADRKETEELYMVLDEELKMMAGICPEGGRVRGPHLREMARLAHTEYFIEGRSDRDVRDVLRETMFAPTVTGSPLESACRVIRRHEPEGRGYYSGVMALIGHDREGRDVLDSSILIRTADIDRTGTMRIGTGATLVRHSDPYAEVAETRAKASGLLAALDSEAGTRFADHPEIRRALSARNGTIAPFWLGEDAERTRTVAELLGRTALVVDAEDTFTGMLSHQLSALGLEVTVRRFDEDYRFGEHDLVVMGPGPGDPHDDESGKIAHLRGAVRTLLAGRRPFLAVCLSHQVLCRALGLTVARCAVVNQGLQREVDLFGEPERVGFYNTFTALSRDDKVDCPGVGIVEVSRDRATEEVFALRGPHFASMQFHAESVLSQGGVRILGTMLKGLMRP